MYKILLTLDEKKELTDALEEKIVDYESEYSELDKDFRWAKILKRTIEHLKNIKLKVENSTIEPTDKGQTNSRY